MTCERLAEQLSALIDDELDPKTKANVTEHLRTCSTCVETYRDLQSLVKASRELEPVAPPDRLFLAIRRQARTFQHRPWFAPQRIGWILLPAVATVVLMLVFFPRGQNLIPTVVPLVTPLVAEKLQPPVKVAPEAAPVAPARSASRSGRKASRPVPSPEASPAVAVSSPARSSAVVTAVSLPMAEEQTRGSAPTDVVASLREIQQGLEEIEAAMYDNPGNPQVVRAYQLTYQKGLELKDRYLLGAR